MIYHILLAQPKPETTPEEMEAIFAQFKALKGKIPGLLDVQAGPNKHTVNQGYTYGFVMTFVDEEHLKAYSPHPAHRAISPELRRLSSTLLNFDIPQE
ncbi:Dabb family protein [Ktedonosporobacter rubrisoli]|uniref:Dabb family protein n=1 Tax=Ktedonosporobacter rubrisoli TaxID=2509675 RepID=A0A4P6JWV4_KTERU|nr:Dabb family protein [Ktedonosporobacter rubrisoli]QBD80197.1 Dabb family protein [Ktedonosporobacter rubrisoli]